MAGEKHTATLVRGNTYMYGGTRFDHGDPVPVTEDEMEYLAENAIDELTVAQTGETVVRDKFEFAPIGDAEDGQDEAEDAERQPWILAHASAAH